MQTSMVSYYNPAAMYRHQQSVTTPAGAQFHSSGSPMHSWYGYHHQAPQMSSTPTPSYCMQEEQQMWHHPAAHPAMFHQEFQEFVGHPGMPLQQHQVLEHGEAQLPSPPITVSGSDMSSPGVGGGAMTPPQTQTRPTPVRSPYEWIKKTSYQSQPNPEACPPFLPDFPAADCILDGKTRTKDKYRVVYTDHQRIELEKEFTFKNKYITMRRKAELALNLGLSERQIKIWFQNRRAKERKQVKKRVEEKNQLEAANHHQQMHHHVYMPNQILGSLNGNHVKQQQDAMKVEDVWPKAPV